MAEPQLPIDFAIRELEQKIASYHPGLAEQPGGKSVSPQPGEADWFLLRALATGLSLLRSLRARGISASPAASERFYRQNGARMKKDSLNPDALPEPLELEAVVDSPREGIANGPR